MNILALETSSSALSVAFYTEDTVLLKHELLPLQHAKAILPLIESLVGSQLSKLDLVAWGAGPGSFTGLRIAASVVQAIGFTHNIPIVSVSSLAALAETVYEEEGFEKLLVAVDARMNELYFGAYQKREAGVVALLGNEALMRPEELVKSTADWVLGEWVGVGNAWSIYSTELEEFSGKLGKIASESLPKASAVARLGKLKYERGEWLRPEVLLPQYLRETVVKLNK